MLSQATSTHTPQVQVWSIDSLVFYVRNPRKNDGAVDRMCSSIREFGFKTPVLARSDGTVVDGHLGNLRKLRGPFPGYHAADCRDAAALSDRFIIFWGSVRTIECSNQVTSP